MRVTLDLNETTSQPRCKDAVLARLRSLVGTRRLLLYNSVAMDFDFPSKIAELILEQWAKFGAMPNYEPGPPPPLSLLTALLNQCFFASLKQEEGRTTQFDLALCSPSQMPEASFRFSKFTRIFNLFRFEKPAKLSVHELVRLAPACNPEKTVILAGQDNDAEDLVLWGVVDMGWRPPVTATELTKLRLRVLSPGEIQVRLHDRLLCTYQEGRISQPERALVNSGCVYDFFRGTSLHLCREIKDGTGHCPEDNGDEPRDYRAMAYLFVLQEMIERIHRPNTGAVS